MGCCGVTVYPRNQEVDNAADAKGIATALQNVVKQYNEEKADLESHLKKGTPIKTEALSGMDDASCKQRVPYLGDLTDACQEMIQTINGCNDQLPLQDAKDLIQKVLGNYYVAYDQTKKYQQDLNNFKQFATQYKKTR